MVQKTNKSRIHRKKVTKENDLTQEMISRILMLHELGVPPEAMRLDLCETCHAKVPFRFISMTTDKMDSPVEEWLNRMRNSIGRGYVP